MVVYLGDAVARVYITHKHIKNALKEAGLEVKKGPRRLPERNCDGIPVQSNRIQTRCVPIGYNDGTPLEEAMANFEWPYKLRVTLKFQDQDEQDQNEKPRVREQIVWMRYAAKGEHANPPISLPDLMECCHQPRGKAHHLHCWMSASTKEERMALFKRGRSSREMSGEKQPTPREAPNQRACHKYERGRCEEQDNCRMKHSETPIEKIPCNLPVATEMQRLQLGMSPCDHLIVCARGGPPRCKYSHDQWTPESHKTALAKEQEEWRKKQPRKHKAKNTSKNKK